MELQTNTIPWREGFYSLPFCSCPAIHQGIDQQHRSQYRAPSSGPRRNQRRKGFRKAEAQNLFKEKKYESSGSIAGDRSTGIHPGYAQIGANDNSRTEKVWKTPSRNPNCWLTATQTQQMRTKPYNRNRSSRTRRKRTDNVGPSAYEIPIVESKSVLILSILFIHPLSSISSTFTGGMKAGNPNIPTPARAMLSTWATSPASSALESTGSTSTAYTETTKYKNEQKGMRTLLIIRKSESSITYFCRACRRRWSRYHLFRIGYRLKGGNTHEIYMTFSYHQTCPHVDVNYNNILEPKSCRDETKEDYRWPGNKIQHERDNDIWSVTLAVFYLYHDLLIVVAPSKRLAQVTTSLVPTTYLPRQNVFFASQRSSTYTFQVPTSLRPSTPVVSSRTWAPLPPEGNYFRCEIGVRHLRR